MIADAILAGTAFTVWAILEWTMRPSGAPAPVNPVQPFNPGAVIPVTKPGMLRYDTVHYENAKTRAVGTPWEVK